MAIDKLVCEDGVLVGGVPAIQTAVNELVDEGELNYSLSYKFPFQKDATFYATVDDSIHLELRDFLRFIVLYGCDSTHQYGLGTVRRFQNNIWYLEVVDLTAGGVVCNFNTGTDPEDNLIFELSEASSSGVTGVCQLNWSAITYGAVIAGNQTYERCGFCGDVYIDKIKPSNSTIDIEILEIPKIFATVGHEVNLYFDNIIRTANQQYVVQVSGVGEMDSRHWFYTPATAGTYSITIKVSINADGTILKSVTIPVEVTEASNDSDPVKKVLCIGDSITNYGDHIQTCIDNFEHSNSSAGIEFLGTRGTTPALHEGYPGWRTFDFLEKETYAGLTNAFYNPVTEYFDFGYYLTANLIDTPDVVVIALGTNDAYGSRPDVYAGNIELLINKILEHSASIDIVVSMVLPNGKSGDVTRDGFDMSNTNWGLFSHYYATFEYNKYLIDEYGENTSGVLLMPANINLDRKYNFEIDTIATNDRLANSYTKSGDTLHPLIEGRRQMGDSYYYYLKSN